MRARAGGPGWGRGGAGPREGRGREAAVEKAKESSEEAPEFSRRGLGVRVGDARRPSPGCRESAQRVETLPGSRLLLAG